MTEPTLKNQHLQTWKADFFKALAHPARIRILEYLRAGERSAGEIMHALGLEQSNASQHLAVLRSKDIVVARRDGASILYSARDPVLYEIMDLLRQYFYDHLSEVRGMLEELEPAEHPSSENVTTES
ncbi:MAG TPA: metalloregulator ArsR/SmtB family transcription factor [Armatimonadota bacterium]|nr:metalloregulator ArsR/SmtB family transcription factor [Armatimonadota bacterium]